MLPVACLFSIMLTYRSATLSYNSFRIEFIPSFISDRTLHSGMKLKINSTFIMAEIKIVCKMGNFIHVLKYTRKNAQVVTSLQTSCNRSVHKLSTSCVRTACS